MAAAVPAAIGLGGSVFSGITGKNAAKKQQQMAEQQMAMLRPVIDAQSKGITQALGQSSDLFHQSTPFIQGAGQAVNDLQNFWKPLMSGNRSAIDQFLAPERGEIMRGDEATRNYAARFAPRGSLAGTLTKSVAGSQGKLNDLVFGARKEAANQMGSLSDRLANLGLGTGQLGASTLSAGINGGQNLFNLLEGQQNRAFSAQNQAANSLGGLGSSLGGFINSIFKNTGGGKGGSTKPSDPNWTNWGQGGGE